jgi:pimeloyl-ACP methyl ester carboxylesterase
MRSHHDRSPTPKPLYDGLDYASRGGALKRARSRRAVRRLTAHASEGALNRLERVTLGGASHTLLTRSSGQDQAVALYIHGFLDPALAAARRVGWASGLEDQFTVVYWERRGYASAYRRGLDASTMTVDQATDDAVELIDILVARHDRSIHLIGHSLGSVVALSAAAARPQAIASVTALAPVIDNQAGDSIVWERVQRRVTSAPGLLLHRQPKRLGPPPYPARKALLRLSVISRTGGLYRDRYAGLGRLILESIFASWRTPEYTLVDLVRASAMIRFIVRSSWIDVMSLRMDDRVQSLLDHSHVSISVQLHQTTGRAKVSPSARPLNRHLAGAHLAVRGRRPSCRSHRTRACRSS